MEVHDFFLIASGFAAAFLLFHQRLIVALFIAGTLTATSIGITVRVLMDLHRHQSREAQVVLGAAVWRFFTTSHNVYYVKYV